MKPYETVGVKELKNKLSEYLRLVRGGTSLLITDRNQVIAELHKPSSAMPSTVTPLIDQWIHSGLLQIPPQIQKRSRLKGPIKTKEPLSKKLIDEDRS